MSYRASPSVRAYALKMGVELQMVSERTGRLRLDIEDVDQFVAGAGKVNHDFDDARYWNIDHSLYGEISQEPLSRVAVLASKNLSAANRTIPQVTHQDHADISALEVMRKRYSLEGKARGIKLTGLAFQIKALSLCLSEFPRFNAALSPDGKTLTHRHYIHIGVAVDTPHGLIVPVIRDADQKRLLQIASEINSLASSAQARKVRSDEMGGASMSISNLGGIGGSSFTPIVNPPEVAILGVSRTELRPVWNGTIFEPVPVLPLSLSYDHRVVNGADAARFTRRLAELLADPRLLLI